MRVAGAAHGSRPVAAVRVRVPLRRPMGSARGDWPACDAWLVQVRDAEGRTGVGEATLGPLPSGARQAGLDACVRAAVAGDAWEAGGDPATAAVRAAIDGACLDIGAVAAHRPRAASIGVNAIVDGASPDEVAASCEALVAAGFRTLKLKVGRESSTATFLERVVAARAAAGPGVALRLDANGAWDVATAIARLCAVVDAGVSLEYAEQPVGDGLGRVRSALGGAVAIAADEQVTDRDAARALLQTRAVDALVVKPVRVGGPQEALAIADLAAAMGARVTISTLLETGVGLLAAIATAAMLTGAGAHDAHGVGTGGLLADDLVGGASLVTGGVASVPAGPGLGIAARLEHAALDRFAVDRVGRWA